MRTARTPASPVNIVTYEPVDRRVNYLDVDPSASAVLHFTPNLQLRLAWTKTFSRPDFSQLNPSMNLIEVTNAVGSYVGIASAGNPDLEPVRSENWDASLEWYFGRAGMISAAAFKRDINGFIVNTVQSELIPGSAGEASVTRPVNAGDGSIKGFEISGTTFFDFAPGILHNLGVSANFTYLDTYQLLPQTAANVETSGPIQGVSDKAMRASIFYDDGKFQIRVAYAKRSKFLLRVNTANRDYDQYYYPISRLDTSVTYRFTNNISLSLDATNLLSKPQSGYWGQSDFVDRVYYEGRTFSTALRFKF